WPGVEVMALGVGGVVAGVRAGIGVAGLTVALRPEPDEFANRLHTIAGLVELGRGEEAIRLIAETSGMHQELSEMLMERMGDPVLGALLLAKAAIASERGIELRVSDDTVLTESPLQPDDLITLLGNLIDNAVDAAAQSAGERWVGVAVGAQDRELVIRVQDSGRGVPVADRERVFVEGFSTKARTGSRRRGMGLALAREVARRNGGDVTVACEHGAVFTARLPLRVAAAQ